MTRLILVALALALLAPASVAPAPALEIRAYADVRGLSVYWQAPAGQEWVCVQRRGAWPPLADTPVGCVETSGGAAHIRIRDEGLRMDQGGDTLLIVYDEEMQPLAWGRERTRARYQTWWPWWGG